MYLSTRTIRCIAIVVLCAVAGDGNTETRLPADYVDPFIGTSNYGATHPGAQYPHGMASVVPFNVAHRKGDGNVFEKDSEWHSRPYVHENQFLTGFSHVNLSGVGCPELGSILLMPTTGELELDSAVHGSTYTDEVSSPGYYRVRLDKHDVEVEVSSTLRTGISRYRFPDGQSHVLLNLGLGLTNESGAMVRVVSDTEVEGYKTIGTFCYQPEDVRPVYFVARLSKPARVAGTFKKQPAYRGVEAEWVAHNATYKPYPGYRQEMAGDDVGAYFSFDTAADETVEVKLGVSYVSIENARANLSAEQPGFDFEQTRRNARDRWNELLGRVELVGTDRNKTLFYTALYHVLVHPNMIQDVNGDYPLMEQPGFGNTEGGNRYSVYSLWDTYRNVHPLLSLLYPELQSEMVTSMVDMYRESGWLPKWELLGMETDVMVGDPALPVITDTYVRGIRDFDVATAYAAMRKHATAGEHRNRIRPYMDDYAALGYIPVERESRWGGTVASSLEYYIADWNTAVLARELGQDEDAELLFRRAQGYRNYFDPHTGMLRPRRRDGSWHEPFDPEMGKNFEPVTGFVEGTAWNYRFYVPHDIPGLIELLGGPSAFVQALVECFSTDNFDMSNEPDIAYPFLFNYVAGEEWRSQRQVQALIEEHFHDTPGGIPGNDDAGTLSAWLAFSMLGIYPVLPGDTRYALVAPSFDEIRLHLNTEYYAGDAFVIRAGQSSGARFISGMALNGEAYTDYFLDHGDIVTGGRFDITLSERR